MLSRGDCMKSNPNVIIFDFDQTLVDLFQNKNWFKVLRQRIFEHYTKYLKPEKSFEEYTDENYYPYEQWIEVICETYSAEDAESINKVAEDIVLHFEREVIDSVEYFDDVHDTLKELHSRGIKLGIASNNGISSIEYSLAKENLLHLISAISGRRFPFHVRDEKPNPFYLLEVKNKIANVGDEIWYVGDRPTDVQAAIGAGMKPIGVATGNFTKEELEDAGAHMVLERLSSILNYL